MCWGQGLLEGKGSGACLLRDGAGVVRSTESMQVEISENPVASAQSLQLNSGVGRYYRQVSCSAQSQRHRHAGGSHSYSVGHGSAVSWQDVEGESGGLVLHGGASHWVIRRHCAVAKQRHLGKRVTGGIYG